MEQAAQKTEVSDNASSTQVKLPPIGFHAPIAGGLDKALIRAYELECTSVQIFSRNPRGWTARPLSNEEIERFHSVRKETGIVSLLIHACYLINLASLDNNIRDKSIKAFREELERGIALKADYLVVHPGSTKGGCELDGIRSCIENLRLASEGLDLEGLQILLENTAGQGACIGHRFEHLRQIIEALPELKLGVCFDTAHAFTSGYDISSEEGLTATIESLDHNIGLENVRAIHFNDSKAIYNSRVDRHWHIGLGHIGRDALQRVARHPKLTHASFILETPQDEEGSDTTNLKELKSFFVGDG
jgi:deoxyribonuclease IV